MVITVESNTNDSIGTRQADVGCLNPWLVLQISGVFEEEQMQSSPPRTAFVPSTRW